MNVRLSETEAHALLIKWMHAALAGANRNYNHYGYDIYIPAALAHECGNDPNNRSYMRDNVPVLCEAAWELCRRGRLSPGTTIYEQQGNSDGQGFTITSLGKAWLAESADDRFIPSEPGQIAQLLTKYRKHFGDGFQERAQEAVRCWGANAFLACCVMCGAAAESILLAIAFAKTDEASVLKAYKTTSGRRQVEKIVLGSAPEWIRKKAEPGLELIKYWRDDAAHGTATNITDAEAYTSLSLLLRFAALANDHWTELVAQ